MNLERNEFATPRGLYATRPDLAHIEPFDLGDLRVIPAERRLVTAAAPDIVLEPLVMQVLVALANSGGRTMSRDDLVAACWGRRIVGDDAINRVISRLRRSLASICGDHVRIETVAKVGYRLDVQADGPARSRSGWHRRIAAIAAATIGVTGLAAAAMFLAAPAAGIAIAIEPAPSLARDEMTSNFTSDITNDIAELTGSMTRLTLVQPKARTNADMRLEFAYREDGTSEVARTRLIDTANGAVIWSHSFAGNGEGQAVVRARAAHAIAGVIRCGFDHSAGDLGDPVSRRLYFAACDAFVAHDWPTAQSFAEQIVARRPDSAASWACLAITIVLSPHDSRQAAAAASKRAMGYARKALALDSRSGLAHQALAMSLYIQDQNGFDELEAGIKGDPDHGWLLELYASALLESGYAAASVDPALHAVALEPGDVYLANMAVYNLLGAGKREDAKRLAERTILVWPDNLDARRSLDDLLFYDADPAAALALFDKAGKRNDSYGLIMRSQLEWRASPARFDWQAFDRLAARLASENQNRAMTLAFAAARMGDEKRALDWLERIPPRPRMQSWQPLFWPELAPIRRDPRFFAVMAKIGLVDFWRHRGQWPDFCSDRALRYDCAGKAAELDVEHIVL